MSRALALATAATCGLVWAAAGTANEAFVDPTGDQKVSAGGSSEAASVGPDITRVEVSNGQDGIVTFRVTIANYTELPTNTFVAIFFDLDRNLDTGDLGDEAQVGWSPGAGLTFERWDGTRMVAAPGAAILASFANGVFTLEIPRSELNDVASFDFLVGGSAHVDDFLATDVAPTLGSHWTYRLVLGALTLRASSLRATPSRPIAGRKFTVSTEVVRTDTRIVVRSGPLACAASIGGSKLSARGSFAAGRARCVVSVPRDARGKLLRGALTVRVDGASVRKAYAFRVLAP